MGKLIDFYKSAGSDESLRLDLEASNKGFADKKDVNKDTVIAEVIKIAKNHGVTLEKADFDGKAEELDVVELAAVAGGSTVTVCVIPGNDGHMPKPGSHYNDGIPRELCTTFGRDPHPAYGLSIKIT
jgi:hypothetical protein